MIKENKIIIKIKITRNKMINFQQKKIKTSNIMMKIKKMNNSNKILMVKMIIYIKMEEIILKIRYLKK